MVFSVISVIRVVVCCLVFEVCVYVAFGGFSGCLRILCAVIYFAYWFCL